MTRREDPVWGTADEAARGNRDLIHVTNTVPQMQSFNAGIWLGLESYALDRAREDDMRISWFTGPFLLPDDPVRDGVKIPRSFWKVIAFVHDETRQLCAAGYTMSQDEFLREEEFVFSQHRTSQVRISSIERRTGLSFGPLAALDPFAGDEEGVDARPSTPSRRQSMNLELKPYAVSSITSDHAASTPFDKTIANINLRWVSGRGDRTHEGESRRLDLSPRVPQCAKESPRSRRWRFGELGTPGRRACDDSPRTRRGDG